MTHRTHRTPDLFDFFVQQDNLHESEEVVAAAHSQRLLQAYGSHAIVDRDFDVDSTYLDHIEIGNDGRMDHLYEVSHAI